MNISKDNRKIILDEIKIVRKKMKEEKDPFRKIYYYSGIYGMLSRIFNIQYDSQLTFMNFVFQASYNQINALFISIKSGDTRIIPIPNFFEKLDKYLGELQKAIKNEKDEDIYQICEKFICLTYTTMGNGYYLYQKGVKVIPD